MLYRLPGGTAHNASIPSKYGSEKSSHTQVMQVSPWSCAHIKIHINTSLISLMLFKFTKFIVFNLRSGRLDFFKKIFYVIESTKTAFFLWSNCVSVTIHWPKPLLKNFLPLKANLRAVYFNVKPLHYILAWHHPEFNKLSQDRFPQSSSRST